VANWHIRQKLEARR